MHTARSASASVVSGKTGAAGDLKYISTLQSARGSCNGPDDYAESLLIFLCLNSRLKPVLGTELPDDVSRMQVALIKDIDAKTTT